MIKDSELIKKQFWDLIWFIQIQIILCEIFLKAWTLGNVREFLANIKQLVKLRETRDLLVRIH